jgi:hypothetical protein
MANEYNLFKGIASSLGLSALMKLLTRVCQSNLQWFHYIPQQKRLLRQNGKFPKDVRLGRSRKDPHSPTEEISAKCIRTSEGSRGVNFQFPPWGRYGCFLECPISAEAKVAKLVWLVNEYFLVIYSSQFGHIFSSFFRFSQKCWFKLLKQNKKPKKWITATCLWRKNARTTDVAITMWL